MFFIRKINLTVLICLTLSGICDAASRIKPAADAPNIVRITSDSLILISGFTMQFSVDSPEGQGPVSTGITAGQLNRQLLLEGDQVAVAVYGKDGSLKTEGKLLEGDVLHISDGATEKNYAIGVQQMALRPKLTCRQDTIRMQTACDLVIDFTAGQRSPQTTIRVHVPPGIRVTPENTRIDVIGRGEVKLSELKNQSVGRTGADDSRRQVGQAMITDRGTEEQTIVFSGIDLRPLNGIDLRIRICGLTVAKAGDYLFKADYTTAEPGKYCSPTAEARMTAVSTVADFSRLYNPETDDETRAVFRWTPVTEASQINLLRSADKGRTWQTLLSGISPAAASVSVEKLQPNLLYAFKLEVKGGENQGESNPAWFYSGKLDVREFGVVADGNHDNTRQINEAIDSIHRLGGGTLLFKDGTYCVRTVHLKSNICLFLEKGATIKAIKGADAPEETWFSDRKYRSGLSPTDPGPYDDPENYLTKQDVGHTFFKNTMFYGERLNNVKITGNGRITGDGNLVTSDKVMNNLPDKRADKMFTFKLCTNIEIGGIPREEDLWYDENTDEPCYIGKKGIKDFACDNMLDIDQGGHFALLATGTDHIYVHDTWFGKSNTGNARDIYDFMGCNDVRVTNIYCKVSSDDIVKLGSDCSLGYTRPGKNYKIRNIIGDTNCNLFQIGSETADDITDVCVDNIYVLGANKAGFSISTNDGGHVKNIHLNCGHTGTIHSRSVMLRTTTPFFISVSNRGRILGANVERYRFTENGEIRDELLCTNVSIGKVENIILRGVDSYEVYGGSSFRGERWKAYDGSQRKAAPIISGYKLPDPKVVEGGLNFKLPDGRHTGYITNIVFDDIHVLVKGGNSAEDSKISPKELGVGQYNVSNLGVQPSYGLWARHVKNLLVKDCSFNYEIRDNRYALFLDDVNGARISSVKMVRPKGLDPVIKFLNSSDITMDQALFYQDKWGQSPSKLPTVKGLAGSVEIPGSE